MSNGLNLLHPRKDVAEMVIVFVCPSSFLRIQCLQWNQVNMCIKSHRFLCHPYRSWEFHDGIKYQYRDCNKHVIMHYKNPEITIMESTKSFFSWLNWGIILATDPTYKGTIETAIFHKLQVGGTSTKQARKKNKSHLLVAHDLDLKVKRFYFLQIRIQPQAIWLVVSTPLKNISQNGNLPQIGMKIKNIRNHTT